MVKRFYYMMTAGACENKTQVLVSFTDLKYLETYLEFWYGFLWARRFH